MIPFWKKTNYPKIVGLNLHFIRKRKASLQDDVLS